ncbi:hypothetical protein ONZ43_g1498 [Nemania bipapillata]|uniref:Uncharacterized protein n=1 Tax=Nemania bipapillata TaxID=110536 RepID=A0ACC2J500_9PEZI|nr:hypothetical protein ONZ43_g1498 [Nemania bipapillata]
MADEAKSVQRHELIPVLATRSCEMVASFLGVLKAGACYVPIDIEAWTKDRVQSTLERVSARVLINLSTSIYSGYHEIPLDEVEAAFETAPRGIRDDEAELPQASIQPMDLAYTIFTSGTTSEPKGVMIPHRALLNYVQQGDEEAPFNSCPRPEDKSLLTFSPGFDACAGVVFSTLCHGAQLMVAGISEFESYAARATIIAVTPSMLSAIHDVEACSQLRLIIIGGEAPNQRLIKRWSAPGRSLYNGYGPTETTISSLMGRLDPLKPITLGRPMRNSRVLLLDGTTESDKGEICITGPGLALGYYKDDEQTKQKFITLNGERMYRTGDFARRTEHGLEFAGRADSYVKNRGFLVNIDSEVIPILLDASAHTATAFMHRDRLVAFVTPDNLDTLALRQQLLRDHNNSLVPDQIRAVPVIPLTPNGKADNRALRRLLDEEASDNPDIEESADNSYQNSKMGTLKMAISVATSVPQSKITDESRFLDLGGNSLAALKVLSYLRNRHFKLRLKDLLNLPSLQAICGTIQEDELPAGQPKKASGKREHLGDENDKSLSMGPMTALQIPYAWTSSLKADLNLSGLELEEGARTLNATPSALLYTAWGLVLSNYTSSDRVAFGVVFSGRNMIEVPGVERAIGPLLNTVPFPIGFEPDQTIEAAVSIINHSLLQMLEFQWSAAEAMASVPGESINGTLQTLVVTEYDLPPTQDMMSWSVEREDLMEFGLTLLLEKKSDSEHEDYNNEQDQGLQARILFDSSRYAQSAISRLLNHFRNALCLLMRPQSIYMKELRSEFMGAEEKSVILQPPSAFEEKPNADNMRDDLTTIKDTFESAAVTWPHHCAIESPHGNFSYREVDEFADRAATQLMKHVQRKALDNIVVGVLSDTSVYWVIAILAILKAGFICCPLDTSLPPSRINTIIQESGASVFLAANRACQVALEGCDTKTTDDDVIIVDDLLQQYFDSPASQLETTTRAKDTIYLVFTSGSTGVPKGVPLHNVTVLNAIGVPAVRLFAKPGKRISQLSALGFDMALIEIFGSLCYGATLVLKDPNNPFEHIHHVNAMVTTPSFLSALSPEEYPNLDTVLLAGEPVTQKIADVWSAKVQNLLNIYGPSECGCVSGTRLLPGVEGIIGEIYISGAPVVQGYWGNTNKLNTKSRFIPNPFAPDPSHHIMYYTGDLGFWNEDMNISYVGRVDNQIKVRGFRVELEEVENIVVAAGEGNVRSAAAIAINGNSSAEPDNYGPHPRDPGAAHDS